jgi:SAM-dependent methyltransferase
MRQDSSIPEFWETRYRTAVTPWDAGRVPPRLAAFLADEKSGRTVLIPGCGSGYEVAAFAAAGHAVTAVDFSAAAVARARQNLGLLADRVLLGDFFAVDLPLAGFDLVYERTFLCALPRRLWTDYARRVAGLTREGGRLAGFFYFDNNEKGPPFGLKAGELESLLGPYFVRLVDENVPAEESVDVLAGKERWQVWRRLSNHINNVL